MSHPPRAPRRLLGACIAASLAASLAAAPAARAQCDAAASLELTGQVIDARALGPVRARVLVTAGADTLAALDADSTGHFAATVCRRGALVAHFRRLGYRADSLAFATGDTPWAALDVAMVPVRGLAPVTLAESRIVASRTPSAIETRVRRAGGVYVGSRELAAGTMPLTSDVFRGRRGVTLEEVDGAMRIVSTRGPRATLTLGTIRNTVADDPAAASNVKGGVEPCPLRVAVDGHVMPEDFRVDEIAAKDLLAIEIYPGAASIPIEFSSTRRSTTCGLVMIWTRDGTRKAP